MVASIVALAIPLLSTSPVHAILTPHDPIYIDGNAGFTIPDPVNGGGSGTENDPYVIENWKISAGDAHGIYIRDTTEHFVVRNCLVENAAANRFGIYLNHVWYGRIENNTCSNNTQHGICVINGSSNNVIINNTSRNNGILPLAGFGIELVDSNNNALINNVCFNNLEGIFLSRSDNNALDNNTISSNHDYGIILYLSDNCILSRNTILNNGWRHGNDWTSGIALEQSTYNTISNNTCLNNSYYGIGLFRYSDHNILENNTCENNDDYGIALDRGYIGSGCGGNTLNKNTCSNNRVGILLRQSNNNLTVNNICTVNFDFGIHIADSDNNLIFHNNFINNINQADDDGTNYWDNGYPSGGNYWSDYTGVDENKGENQDMPGSDGIGDTPYYIPSDNNRDHYPLMRPWAVKPRAEIRTVIYPAADVYAFSGDGARYSRSQLKFDIGSIPSGSNILSAKLWLYRFAADSWDGEILLNRVDDQLWSEKITAAEFDAETLTNEETQASKFMSPGWDCLGVEDQLNVDHKTGHAYSSYRLRWANDDGSEPSVGIDDGRFLVIESELDELCIFFPSSEYNGSDPYLGVVYVPPYAVSVSISPTYRSGAPGEELSYAVMVANTGDLDDNYVLTVSDNAGWGPTVFPTSLAVASGALGEATLTVTIPENAKPCTLNNITVTTTSHADNTVSDNDSCTAHVEVFRGVEVSILPDYQENLPGGTLEYTVAVRNLGNVGDNYDLIAQDTENWGLTLKDNLLEVPAGENRTSTLSVTIPESAENCTRDNITVTVISQADNAVRNNASCIAHAAAAPSPPSVEVSPFVNLGEAGDNLPYMVTVTNVGYIADNYTITVMDNLAWPISISENEISLAPDENVVIVVKVTVPEDLTEKVADWITLKASGVSGVENSVDFRVISVMPLEEPPYPVAHPEENYYWFSTCTLRVELPAVPIMCGRETGYSVDMTPREPWPMLYGRGEYPLAGAAAIVGNGRVIAQGGLGILRSAPVDQFGDERLAAKKLMPLMVQWLIDWGDPSEHKFLFYCTSGAFHNASRLSEWLNTLENSLGFELDTQEGGMITPELLENYDVLHIVVEASISDNEVHAIADWVENGGALLLMEQADYLGAGNVPTTNEILEALGCSIRFQDDELYDDNHWTKDGPWFPQVYLLDPREVNSEFDIWFPPGIGWDALLTATFSGDSDDAVFGVRPDASSGFDSKYDILEPPAPPEPPFVRAYFYYPEQTPDELHRSCIPPENFMEWPLRIEYADDIENITLTWSVENIPSEYSVLLYRGGASVADMRAEDNYTFEAVGDNHDFRVIVGKLLPFTLELSQGWNMISFPILTENMSPDSIFDGYYVLYRWDVENKRYVLHADSGDFIEPDPDVEVGVGYWVYVLEDENVDLLGFPVNRLTLNLRQGWNLIGPPYGGSSIADPADYPDDSVIPWAFTWNAREKRYDMTQLLEAGKGYWVYTLQDCSLTVERKVTMGFVLGGYVEGSTWDGRYIIAAERLKWLYPWFDYAYDEGVVLAGRDPASSARDLITTKKANLVVGSWEPCAVPSFETIKGEYPEVWFLGNIGSDITRGGNFLRFFPRQYQAMYLEGLVAGALTKTNKIGIAVGPACVQNYRRMAAFYLGIKEVNPNATLYVKYVGEWYNPPVERDVSLALVDLGCDVLTNYTDSTAPVEVCAERGIWYVGKDMDTVGMYGWSSTDTVAVSFDTRWEVIWDHFAKEYRAGVKAPDTLVFLGMDDHIAMPANNPWLPGQTVLPTVDLQNDNKVGIAAISPKARPLIPDGIITLIEHRREQMMRGVWDPFYEYEFISSGEGVELPELPVPPSGTVVKPAGVMPSDEFLLTQFNFQLEGIVHLA